MMKRRMALAVAMICAMTAMAPAQSRPDFSGTWEMDAVRTRAANQTRQAAAGGGTTVTATTPAAGGGSFGFTPGGGAPAVLAVKITHTTAALTVNRISGQVWEKVVHDLTGTRSISTNGNSTMKLTSRWDGARLISEGTSETQLSDGEGVIGGTVREVRWLEKPGVMVVETTRAVTTNTSGAHLANGNRPKTSVQYFTKR